MTPTSPPGLSGDAGSPIPIPVPIREEINTPSSSYMIPGSDDRFLCCCLCLPELDPAPRFIEIGMFSVSASTFSSLSSLASFGTPFNASAVSYENASMLILIPAAVLEFVLTLVESDSAALKFEFGLDGIGIGLGFRIGIGTGADVAGVAGIG